MFNKEDDYFNAIKHAQVYASTETRSSNKKLLIGNFLFLALLGYATFTYLQTSSNGFSLPVFKQAVLGVSETVDDSELANDKLMKVLKGTEVGVLQDSMKVLMSEPSIQSKSSYTEAIARVLDDKSGFRGRIAVVNQSTEDATD
jgi:hypothetical protein